MSNKYIISDCTQMNRRKLKAERFYNSVFEPDEIPFLVTDEASLGAIYLGDEFELIKKIKEKYGITINSKHFKMPFWKLIDFLEQKNLD